MSSLFFIGVFVAFLITQAISTQIRLRNNLSRSVYNPALYLESGGIASAPEILGPGHEGVIIIDDENLAVSDNVKGLLKLNLEGSTLGANSPYFAIAWYIPKIDEVGSDNRVGFYFGSESNLNTLYQNMMNQNSNLPTDMKMKKANQGWYDVHMSDGSLASVFMGSDSLGDITVHLEENMRPLPNGDYFIQSATSALFLRFVDGEVIFDNFSPEIVGDYLFKFTRDGPAYIIRPSADQTRALKSLWNETIFASVVSAAITGSTIDYTFRWTPRNVGHVYTLRRSRSDHVLDMRRCHDGSNNYDLECTTGRRPLLHVPELKYRNVGLFRLVPNTPDLNFLASL